MPKIDKCVKKEKCPKGEVDRFKEFFKHIKQYTLLPEAVIPNSTSEDQAQNDRTREELINQYHKLIILVIDMMYENPDTR